MAWQDALVGHVLGIVVSSALFVFIMYARMDADATDRAHEVEVNPKILGVERVLSAPRSQSFLYRGQLRDAYLTIEVYRVGHVYTARVQVTKNGRWWAFLRPATAGEAGVWRSIFASRQIIITPVFKK